MFVMRVTVFGASPSRQLDLLVTLRAPWGAVFCLLRDKSQENLWGHFETWVGSKKGFKHIRFVVCHEFDAIVHVGKGAKDVD